MSPEDRKNSPYEFRDESASASEPDPEEREVVIVDGTAMSYRVYRR